MHTKRFMKDWLLGLVTWCSVLAAAPGCELLVDFDRTKIPTDAEALDGTLSDGGTSVDEGGNSEESPGMDGAAGSRADGASPDATLDGGSAEAAPSDATVETGSDAASETGGGTGGDAANEAGNDASTDAASEVGDETSADP